MDWHTCTVGGERRLGVQAGRRKRKRKAIEPKRGGDSECHHLAGHHLPPLPSTPPLPPLSLSLSLLLLLLLSKGDLHLPSKCNKERKEEATKAQLLDLSLSRTAQLRCDEINDDPWCRRPGMVGALFLATRSGETAGIGFHKGTSGGESPSQNRQLS